MHATESSGVSVPLAHDACPVVCDEVVTSAGLVRSGGRSSGEDVRAAQPAACAAPAALRGAQA
eukprot:4185795-Pyramimonas_sp.AAC.2